MSSGLVIASWLNTNRADDSSSCAVLTIASNSRELLGTSWNRRRSAPRRSAGKRWRRRPPRPRPRPGRPGTRRCRSPPAVAARDCRRGRPTSTFSWWWDANNCWATSLPVSMPSGGFGTSAGPGIVIRTSSASRSRKPPQSPVAAPHWTQERPLGDFQRLRISRFNAQVHSHGPHLLHWIALNVYAVLATVKGRPVGRPAMHSGWRKVALSPAQPRSPSP